MLKLVRWVIVVALALGAGYYMGSLREDKVQKIFNSFRSESSSKISSLEREVRSLQMKAHIASAKDRLTAARDHIQARNFGNAEEKVSAARADLEKALDMVPQEAAATLRIVLSGMEPVIPMLQRSDPGASSRIKRLEDNLARIIEDLRE